MTLQNSFLKFALAVSQNGGCGCKEFIQDISVVIATGNGLDYFGSIPGRGTISLFSIGSITDSEAHIQWLPSGLFPWE
jgi:hypothetical protein